MIQKTSRALVAKAVVDSVDKGASIEDVTRSLAEYVLSEGRTRELESILRHIDTEMSSRYGTHEVQVTSAHELTDAVRKSIRALFSELGAVRLHEEQDPALVGGIRLRAQDQVLDVSVKTKLRQMKQQIKV